MTKYSIEIANNEPTSMIKGKKTGREFLLTDYMYGCIAPQEDNPLSAISITGNSMSVDIWTGCALQCAYCHVQGVLQDIDPKTGTMRRRAVRRNKFSIEEILSELIKHPLFEKNTGVISICTSSTEPFNNSEVIQSTIDIMKWFITHNLKNPFWIVTKAGVPDEIVDKLKEISKTNKIIISVCWAKNDKKIEPFKKDRFRNITKFRNNENISFNWYLRPLVKEWNNDFNDLEDMFKMISDKYKEDISAIIPGGLRWTEGIEYGMTEIRNLSLPENVSSASRHTKTLTNSDFKRLKELAEKYFYGTPLYKHSSCAVSYILKTNNIALTNFIKPLECQMSICPDIQRNRCKTYVQLSLKEINEELNKRGIDILISHFNSNEHVLNKIIVSKPDVDEFSPSIKQQIISIISRYLTVEANYGQ